MNKFEFNTLDEFVTKLEWMIENNPDYSPEELYNALIEQWTTIWWKRLENINFNEEAAGKIKAVINKQDDSNSWELLEFEEWYQNPEAESEEDNTSSFIESTKWEDWGMKSWQEKLKAFTNEYNSILKKAAKFVNEKNHWEWLVGEWKKQFNEELNKYKKQLENLEKSPEFKQLMKDIAEWGTWKLFDNWIANADINQTLKMATAWMWSKLFNDKKRIGNYLSEYATSWWGKFVNELAQSWWWLNFLWIAPWVIASVFTWNDAQDIAKKYLESNKAKDTKKTNKSDTKKPNKPDTKKVWDNWTPSNDTPLNWTSSEEEKENESGAIISPLIKKKSNK